MNIPQLSHSSDHHRRRRLLNLWSWRTACGSPSSTTTCWSFRKSSARERSNGILLCKIKRISSQPEFFADHHHSFMFNVMRKNTLIFPLIVWISAHFPSLCSDSIEREKLCSWCRWTRATGQSEGGFYCIRSAFFWLRILCDPDPAPAANRPTKQLPVLPRPVD